MINNYSNFPYAEHSVIMAPLSGYTDLPFRRACRDYGCHYAFTPMVDVGSIVFNNPHSQLNLLRGADEPWLGLQLLGADPRLVKTCLERLGDRCFEVMDFNLGCPVPKVIRRGAGAALSENPELAVRCLEAAVRHSPWPVTVKTRVLDERDPAPTISLARRLAETGIQALTVHGRIRQMIYGGPVWTGIIAAVRASLDIPVIANGGVINRKTADDLRTRTGCSRLMVARGAIGNPWLFRELADRQAPAPSHEEICSVMHRQIIEMIELYGEDVGLRNARKIILAYLVGRGYRRQRRHQVKDILTREDFERFHLTVRKEGPVGSR